MLDEEMMQNTDTNEEESSTTKPTNDKDSILTSIKKMLGIAEDYEHFDTDIIIHINTALMVLNQLGVGPSTGFSIFDKTAVWTDFVPDINRIEGIKTYVYLKVKLIFDPPQSGAGMDAINGVIKELECRINIAAETKTEEV